MAPDWSFPCHPGFWAFFTGRGSRLDPVYSCLPWTAMTTSAQHKCKGCVPFTCFVWPGDNFIIPAVLWEDNSSHVRLHQVSRPCNPFCPGTVDFPSPLDSPVSSQHHQHQYHASTFPYYHITVSHPSISLESTALFSPTIFHIILVSRAFSNDCFRQGCLVTSVSSLPPHLFQQM